MHCTETYNQERFSNVAHQFLRAPRHLCNHGNTLFTNSSRTCHTCTSTNGLCSIIYTEKPKYSRFAIKSVRISSFRTFPGNNTQTATQLAEAGFFYSGKDDVVYCFFCGQGLRSWDPEDEPWIEHAKWSPNCQYIKDVKGIEFINRVQVAKSDPDLMDVLVQSYRGVTNQGREPMDITDCPGTNQGERIPTDYLIETMAAQSIMKTGYSRTSVAQAIDIYLKQNSSTDFKSDDLMKIIFDLEDGLLKYEEIITSPDTAKISENIDVHNIRSMGDNEPDIETDDCPGTNQGERIPTDYLIETMAAQSIMKTGYSRTSVAQAIDIYLKQNSSTDFKSDDLMKIIFDLEDGLLKYEEIITSPDTAKISENIDVHNIRSMGDNEPDIETDGETTLDLDFLKNENTKLKERTICRLCKIKTVSVVFLPCGHLCCCLTCAPDLDHCPKCNQFIKATVKTYLT